MSTEDIIWTVLGVMIYLAGAVVIHDWLEKHSYSKFKSVILALTWPGTFLAILVLALIDW